MIAALGGLLLSGATVVGASEPEKSSFTRDNFRRVPPSRVRLGCYQNSSPRARLQRWSLQQMARCACAGTEVRDMLREWMDGQRGPQTRPSSLQSPNGSYTLVILGIAICVASSVDLPGLMPASMKSIKFHGNGEFQRSRVRDCIELLHLAWRLNASGMTWERS